MLKIAPTVYLVRQEYQILFVAPENGVAWCEVGGEKYPDERGGLMVSETLVHRCVVPAEALDSAGAYTVCFRALKERRPYFPVLGDLQTAAFAFRRPDRSPDMRLLMLADTHSRVQCPISMGRFWGDQMDLLILGGDIPAESKTPQDILSILEISAGIAGGERPVLFARGNHDLRGRYALDLWQYIGHDEGKPYFTFRTGRLWGVVLDCGEDKLDACDEYGGLVCCQPFRRRQTAFLRRILDHAADEFAAPGIENRIAICHVPFCVDTHDNEIFDIEREVYAEWTRLLNGMGVQALFCGHLHDVMTVLPGSEQSRYGASFPVFIGARPHPPLAAGAPKPDGPVTGMMITLSRGGVTVRYQRSDGACEGDVSAAFAPAPPRG